MLLPLALCECTKLACAVLAKPSRVNFFVLSKVEVSFQTTDTVLPMLPALACATVAKVLVCF